MFKCFTLGTLSIITLFLSIFSPWAHVGEEKIEKKRPCTHHNHFQDSVESWQLMFDEMESMFTIRKTFSCLSVVQLGIKVGYQIPVPTPERIMNDSGNFHSYALSIFMIFMSHVAVVVSFIVTGTRVHRR